MKAPIWRNIRADKRKNAINRDFWEGTDDRPTTVPSADVAVVGMIVRTAFAECSEPDIVERLAATLQPEDLELVLLFASPASDIHALIADAKRLLAPARVVGCTTAGEISEHGYTEDGIVAIGLPRSHFCTRTLLVEDLNEIDAASLAEQMIARRNAMASEAPDWKWEFTFLLVDGLSKREDALTSALALGLGAAPFFGGSAGDGVDFNRTFIFNDGEILSNAAILVQVRTRCPVKVFKTQHLAPTEVRMVVTGADPARRTVHEINAEPAAREYARILGKDPNQLSPFTFAAHPVVVRMGDQHHVRAIQRVAENGDLVFFSAIDEGVVLTLAEPENMTDHLERELQSLSEDVAPDTILGCDCILRRLEAEQKQMITDLSRILSAHRVVGFSTYGEQVSAMHVNQTLTGVAIYPPNEGNA